MHSNVIHKKRKKIASIILTIVNRANLYKKKGFTKNVRAIQANLFPALVDTYHHYWIVGVRTIVIEALELEQYQVSIIHLTFYKHTNCFYHPVEGGGGGGVVLPP